MDYSKEEAPYYKITKSDYPSREQQIAFLKAYDQKCEELGFLTDELGSYEERMREIKRYNAGLTSGTHGVDIYDFTVEFLIQHYPIGTFHLIGRRGGGGNGYDICERNSKVT